MATEQLGSSPSVPRSKVWRCEILPFPKGSRNRLPKIPKTNAHIGRIRLFQKVWVVPQCHGILASFISTLDIRPMSDSAIRLQPGIVSGPWARTGLDCTCARISESGQDSKRRRASRLVLTCPSKLLHAILIAPWFSVDRHLCRYPAVAGSRRASEILRPRRLWTESLGHLKLR